MSTVPETYVGTWNTEKKSLSEQRKILIKELKALGWEELQIDVPNAHQILKNNLREQLERLNNFNFSEDDWIDCYRELTKLNNGIQDAWILIQKHNSVTIEQKDISKRVTLIDKNEALNNHFQFLISYPPLHQNQPSLAERCSCTLLINGFPLVHIELQESKGESLNQALNQTKRLLEDNFYTENPIYKFLHIFVISNGTKTRYFAVFQIPSKCPAQNKTSRWADSEHRDIDVLEDFAYYFFEKKTLWDIITKYSLVSTSKDGEGEGKKDLKILRSYQIDATEKIIQKIKTSIAKGLTETKPPGGYIWHATGSGKTLTAFKASELAITVSERIQKVLFVVDRLDLDMQTFDVFQSVQDNTEIEVEDATSRADLWKLIGTNKRAIIITTIHKLGSLVKKELKDKRMERDFVLIFDECHRSLGEFFSEIKEVFKHHCIIFGFTGTPIFPPKTKEGQEEKQGISWSLKERPTKWLFGEELAKYTIIDALDDENVLPFKVKGLEVPIQIPEGREEEKNMERLEWITRDIVFNFDTWTQRKKGRKFSALFATHSVDEAIEYYWYFKDYLAEIKGKLKVAVIFSEGDRRLKRRADGESIQEQNALVDSWRQFNDKLLLESSSRLSSAQRTKYKEALAKSVREAKLDLLIVVDMFLTGFDAPRLNTLILDKDMQQRHSIIQAFARTNRPSKDKKCGRIYWYSGDKKNMEEAVKEYGGRNSSDRILWNDEYYKYGKQKLDSLKLALEKNLEEIRACETLRKDGNMDSEELESTILKKKKEFWKDSKTMEEIFSNCQEFEEFEKDDESKELEKKLAQYIAIAEEYHYQLKDDERGILEETLAQEMDDLKSKKVGRKKRWRVDKPKHNWEWDEEIEKEYIEKLIGDFKPCLSNEQKPHKKLLKNWESIKPSNHDEWESSWKNYLKINNFISECSREFFNSFLSELESYKATEFEAWAKTKIETNEKIIAEEIDDWFPGESLFSESFTEKKEEFSREFEKWYREVRQFYNFSSKDLEILLRWEESNLSVLEI